MEEVYRVVNAKIWQDDLIRWGGKAAQEARRVAELRTRQPSLGPRYKSLKINWGLVHLIRNEMEPEPTPMPHVI